MVTGTVNTMGYASPGSLVYSSGPGHEGKVFSNLGQAFWDPVANLIKSVRSGLGSVMLYNFGREGDLIVKLESKDIREERKETSFVTTITVNRE